MRLFKTAALCRHFSSATTFFIPEACSKLFVGGLSYDTNEPVLRGAFEQFGKIIEVKVICDHTSGKSKGFGFIQYSSKSEATTALEKMNDQLVDGRHIRVAYARNG